MSDTDINFVELLNTHRRGEIARALDDARGEVLAAVADTGASGSVTLKLTFKPNKAGQIEMLPEVTHRKPARPLGVGIFWAAPGGEGRARLSRRDPDQGDLLDDLPALRARA